MTYTPKQGDIIVVDFDPSAGKEFQKRRPALVLSEQMFNKVTGLVAVAPITNTNRGTRLEIALDHRTDSTGVIVLAQMASFDYQARSAQFVEKAPKDVVRQAKEIVGTILGIDS